MTAAQIRALEEEAEGKPLDIKIKHTWIPANCPRKAKRRDFVTFHYKGFLEDGKKFDQTYGRGPIRMQLGVGMTVPGLDKGLKGMCDSELRKIHVPFRLSRKKKSKTCKYIPTDEHWIVFDIEMLKVEAWTPELQFYDMDASNDSLLMENEIVKQLEKVRKEFGKKLPTDDIEDAIAAKYYIKYFDANGDGKISLEEYVSRMTLDEEKMKKNHKKSSHDKAVRHRDPGIGWILDFDNDGIISMDELDGAEQILAAGEPEKAAEMLTRYMAQNPQKKRTERGEKDEL